MDRRIDQLFDKTLKRLASYGIFLDKPIRDQPFSFADYPDVQQVIDGIFEEFRQSVEVVITKGLAWEDNLSASKATDIASRYGVAVAQQRSQAVAQRKVGGLDLSQRVWNITDTFHKEVETAMDIALRDGTPANRLATDLKQYLKYPDKLFRRVRDEHGQLQLSKRAKEFHPGAGVYRSSYKNARRLAVTETNMAYHKADNERWRQLDFVLGYEVQVSGTNPNVCPLCVELAGKYPKEFEFVGWHPHCRCHAVPIMEDVDRFQARQEALLRGERIPATGQVTAPPKNFTDHLANNSDRIQRASKAGTLPYFVRDNYKVGKDGTLTPTFNAQSIEARKQGTYGNKLGRKATKEAQTALADHKTLDNFSEAQMKNFEEINKATGYKRGKVMSFEEADNGQSNISRDVENCASCVVIHEMRLRGYDISALKYDARDGSISKLLSEDTRSIWMTAKGKTPEFSALIGGEPDDIVKAIEKQTQPIGSRYHIGWDVSKELGHVVTAERTANGLVIYDPQKNAFLSLEEVVSDMMSGSKIQLLRVDRLLLRSDLLASISSTLK
ncbi:toxin glutamine deamidase domain-containing protein [uncultured Porphyromonas sp.]|uniref:toxin glutamine deamidase domain-containing protein n=1 Tax=uncultured Porphyromonas sp. TaxID=159274 RepID=UPI002613BB8E|nr:toxin glutamine deamidase domain-containing protein [uncultured Porphyromonas sp.]